MSYEPEAFSDQTARRLLGVSDWLSRTRARITKVARYDSSVLIAGPSGTGKELIARAIHAESPRHKKAFIAVNCAAFAPTLFESQMFGHVKGAFTGADGSAPGYFRAADGGTLFLDEVGELDLELQAKLLRVLQERTVVPVGSHQDYPVDLRILAATNRDLVKDVAAGRFRKDLYYRLAVVTIETQALSSRPDDLDVLTQYLLSKICSQHNIPFKPLMPSAIFRLRQHDWPGNVRELENVLERAVLLADDQIEAGDIVFDDRAERRSMSSSAPNVPDEPATWALFDDATDANWPSMSDVERWHIESTLTHTGNNQAAAARLLGIHRNVLRRRMKKHRLIAADCEFTSVVIQSKPR